MNIRSLKSDFGFKQFGLLLIIPSALILSSCTAASNASWICENWSTTVREGVSRTWNPSEVELKALEEKLGMDRSIECFHISPYGKTVFVINSGKYVYNSVFKRVGGDFEFIEEEIFAK